MKQIAIFDTTLRDGEQSPGCSMNIKEKVEMARQLELLGVDVIEAGFAAASQGDFNAVRAIAKELNTATVASLSRALAKDIDSSWEAIKYAKHPRIHVFIATSDIHMEYKLKKTREEVIEQTGEMVRYAKKYCEDIEFSAEDATRSDMDFLCRVFETAIEAGATVLNIPERSAIPRDSFLIDKHIRKHTKGVEGVQLSVHCHNDLGMAVANSLAAIRAGVDQVECTVNGIGERAGNAALEEIAMNLRTRADYYGASCGIDTTQIYKSSRLLTSITGVKVTANKASWRKRLCARSGIHQQHACK